MSPNPGSQRTSSDTAGSTAPLYDKIYTGEIDDARSTVQRLELIQLLQRLGTSENAVVVEVGAATGSLYDIHPGYVGIEYSGEGVARGKELYGPRLDLRQGDATMLPLADNSVDFLFSYATFEHVPNVGAAFDEVVRVLKPGGYGWLKPAWNCRPWTVAKLPQRPYRELGIAAKFGKLLIPIRKNLIVRMLQAMPGRIRREVLLASGRPVPLEWRPLQPDFALIEKYGHVSDDDAFVSMDAHAALTWFAGKSFQMLSHPTIKHRLLVRSGGILVRKPSS